LETALEEEVSGVVMTCIPDLLTLGIDEAGRGPVLGPLVMAGVCLRPRPAARLTRAGVMDSKAFGAGDDAHARRTELAALVLETAESVVVRVIDVAEIDRRVRCHELNVLEREHAASIIEGSAPAQRVIADGVRIFRPLAARFPHLLARDRAEAWHVSVAAASIVAKVRRDELFLCIARRYEPEFGRVAGWGYENAGTQRFLRAYLERHGRLPPEARRTWPMTAIVDAFPPGFDPLADLPALPQLGLFA
jgi:ribonuclease HII